MAKLVVPEKTGKSQRTAQILREPEVLWSLVAGLGITLALVGWIDLGLLWYPLNLGSPEWEFGTISAHFDSMPLGTIGLTFVAVGAIGRGWRRVAQTVAILSGLVAAFLVGAYVIYLLDVPLALKGVAPELGPTVKKAIVKASIYAVTYVAFYGWLARYLWRRSRG